MASQGPKRLVFERLRSHGIVLLMAIGVWWGIRQHIQEVQSIDEKATLEAVISTGNAADADLFRVVSVTVTDSKSNRPSLRVSGPLQEINAFKDDLDNLDARGVRFRLSITKEDLVAAEQNQAPELHQTLVIVPLERFVRYVPQTFRHDVQLEYADATKMVEVLLEDVVQRFVVFRSEAVRAPGGFKVTAVSFPTGIKVKGPWSAISKLPTTPTGETIAGIEPIDLSRRAFPADTTSPRITESFQLLPVTDLTFLNDKGEVFENGRVTIDLAPSMALEPWSQQLQVGILLPYWLLEKQPEIGPRDVLRELTVRLQVDSNQVSRFNEKTVKVELDLTDLDPETVAATAERRGERGRYFEVSDRYLSIRILDKNLVYTLPENVTEDRYFKLNQKIDLVWEE